MKLRDAKKILAGELVQDRFLTLFLRKRGWTDLEGVVLTKGDVDFCLRQLALKTVREAKAGEK